MRAVLVLTMVLAPALAMAQSAPQTPAACETLASLSLPNTAITLAQVVNAGAFTVPANPAARGGGGSSALAGTLGPVPDVPGRVTANTAGLGLGYNGGRGIPPFSALPAFCRVAATLKPSASSDIRMEMWMPIAGWNGHFRGTSPNGLGGVINYNAMGVGLIDGFAVASTDTGHQGGDTAWMQVPDKVTDFAGRAMHETTVAGKALTAAYYGMAPRYSYMIECGGGSAAALHEVQKYPADYDGVVVGGHAAHLTRQIFGQLWLWQATHPNGVAILPAAKLSVIHDAVLAKCDMLDGVKDGLLENPTRCTFDPKEIECPGIDGRRTELPDDAAGRSRSEDLRGTDQSPDERAGLVAALSRQRAGLELLHRHAEPRRHRDDHAARRDSQGSGLGLSDIARRFRSPRRARRSIGHRARQRVEPGHLRLRAARRQTDSVGRLEQRARAGRRRPRLLQPRGGHDRPREHTARGSPLHGARDDRMQRRTGHRHLRHARRHAAMGRARPGAERGDRVARRARQGRAHAAAVSVSAGGDVHRQRQHGRGGNFVCK